MMAINIAIDVVKIEFNLLYPLQTAKQRQGFIKGTLPSKSSMSIIG